MKIVNRILITLVVAIAGLLIYASTQPDSFRVERNLDIKASAAKLFPYVNDFHKGPEWSPWEKTDPQMQRIYSGAQSGKGAIYEWAGNKEAGKGGMEIINSVPNQSVKITLRFIEPMEGVSTVEYILTPKGTMTNVKWIMYGPMHFVSKFMCIFFNMDKMIGSQFEKGLQSLKTLTEK